MNDDELRAAQAQAKKAPKLKVFKGEKQASIPQGWGLVLNSDGKPEPCLHNAAVLMVQAHEWGRRGLLSFDTFSSRVLVERARRLTEADELEITKWFQRNYNWKFSMTTVETAIRSVGFNNSFDALTEHVSRHTWDGVPRVDSFAETYLGAKPTVHHRAAGRVLLLSMAARALYPGCKVDTMVILEGPQGIRKSTAVAALGGPFFSELLATAGSKEANEQVEGAWVMEMGELSGMDKAELTAAKQFMSRTSDRFRRAYKKSVEDVQRRCIIVGTTNAHTYLRDETGGRRWLPIVCTLVALELLRADRDQLIAEAVHRVKAGEPWHLVDEGELSAAREAVDDRFDEDVWTSRVLAYTAGRDTVSIDEVLTSCLAVDTAHKQQKEQNRVARILTRAGWRPGRRRRVTDGESERCYVRA